MPFGMSGEDAFDVLMSAAVRAELGDDPDPDADREPQAVNGHLSHARRLGQSVARDQPDVAAGFVLRMPSVIVPDDQGAPIAD
jgi:hypothetical protein